MPALRRLMLWGWPLMAGMSAASGCKPKASASQCDELITRYAELVVVEKYPDASQQQIEAEQEREKKEARADDALKNCSSEVSQSEYACAIQASTTTAFEKCLE